jgi:hypothetical protein
MRLLELYFSQPRLTSRQDYALFQAVLHQCAKEVGFYQPSVAVADVAIRIVATAAAHYSNLIQQDRSGTNR